jgi:hypothetical protein
VFPSKRDRKRLWKGEPMMLGPVHVRVVSTRKVSDDTA